ncbi:Tekt4p [Sparganum proliferum]
MYCSDTQTLVQRTAPKEAVPCFPEQVYAANDGVETGISTIGFRSGRYAPSEAQESIDRRYMQSHLDNEISKQTREDSKDLMRETNALTEADFKTTTDRLKERLTDLHFWKSELEREILDMITTIDHLVQCKVRVEKALLAIDEAILICTDNLNARQRRFGEDLQQDAVELSLIKIRNRKAVSENDWRRMTLQDAVPVRFYGLPKIHKPNVPLRPIVTLKGAPTYGLSRWLTKHLKKLTEGSEHTAASSTHFLDKVRGVTIVPDEIMVSFDVVSLFTSIPKELDMSVISDLLERKYDDEEKPFKRKHATELLDYCLCTYFTFNGYTYEQIQGTPMGSPISGYLAEAVLQELETRVFRPHKPKF